MWTSPPPLLTTSTAPRTAIVTGASGGIGRAVAERLAADGYTVVVHYAGNEARAKETVDTITAAGGAAEAVRADIADETQVAELFDRAEARPSTNGSGSPTCSTPQPDPSRQVGDEPSVRRSVHGPGRVMMDRGVRTSTEVQMSVEIRA
jgi:NAD(P)-dependent dehydrogenase (short-subunit alcohol dehydrogenase family)